MTVETSEEARLTRATAQAAWEALTAHIEREFHDPDIEALECVLAASRAHYGDDEPVWLFIIGPSSSGKTSIAANCIAGLPQAHLEGDLNMRAMMNCQKGGESTSVLDSYGKSFILVFKDFTSILSKKDDDQKELIALFREMYDGAYERKTAGRWGSWKGKATVIACVTPAIERAWAVHRSLGERFLQVRWPNGNPLKISKRAREQRGREKAISSEMRSLVFQLYNATVKAPTPKMSDELGERIDNLAAIVALLRTHVIRDSHGSRSVIEVSASEEPARIAKALETLACYHALLWGRTAVEESDLQIAIRVGFDSIPWNRSKIIQSIPPDASLGLTDVAKLSHLIRATVEWTAEELEAIGILEHIGSMEDSMTYRFTPKFGEMWQASIPGSPRP